MTKSRSGAGFGKTSKRLLGTAVGLSPRVVSFAIASLGTNDLSADIEVAREADFVFDGRDIVACVVSAMGLRESLRYNLRIVRDANPPT